MYTRMEVTRALQPRPAKQNSSFAPPVQVSRHSVGVECSEEEARRMGREAAGELLSRAGADFFAEQN